MNPGGSRIRSRFSTSLAVSLFVLTMGFTTSACADDSTSPPPRTTGGESVRTGDSGATTSAVNHRKPHLVQVAKFDHPVEIKAAPGFGNLMFVVEQEGRVMVLRKGKKLARPFLDIRDQVEYGGERGLVSIGFPPDYRKNKLFYVYFTDHTGDIRVVEFQAKTAVQARPNSGRDVITIPHRENANHNGGQLQFLGDDLYFGTGDGGGGGDEPGNAQNKDVLLGKMIRIDPRASNGQPYTVPNSNPFVGKDGRDEIFAYGMRNPFRWSFQRTGGALRMMIADVGESEFEEIDTRPVSRALGANFGWNKWEGFSPYDGKIPGTLKPALVLPHKQGNCSVIGGLVVRDPKVPALRGRYIFTDFCNSEIRSFRVRSGHIKQTRGTGISEGQISSFAAAPSGRVYVTSLTGPVFRLAQ